MNCRLDMTTQINGKYRVLLVEDERMLAEILSDTLGDRKFDVTLAYDGAQALEYLRERSFDVIVTDVMMPVMDGFTLVKKLRKEGCSTPVLFLTARSATEDVVKGFETGGNDYLKKPFAIDELIVRINALAARGASPAEASLAGAALIEGAKEHKYTLGRLEFSPWNCTLTCMADGSATKLAARESAVLELLCRNMGQTVEASFLLKELWGDDNYFNLRSLNVYITRLRGHLKQAQEVEIKSIRGVGYILSSSFFTKN